MLRNFASLQSYLQKLLNSILKDVVELSILSIPRKTPLPPQKKKKEEKTSKGKKEKKLLTRKKDESGF